MHIVINKKSSPKWKILPWLTVFFLLAGMSAFAQTPSPTQPGTASNRERAPLFMLYRHFLAYQNHLDRVAVDLNRQGKDGNEFRNHFQQKLGFTDADFAPVRETALRLEAGLRDQDAKMKTAIDAARAKYPRNLPNPSALPPVPPELIQMQKERNALIQREIDQLDATLGTERAATLQALIENDFAPSVQVQTLHPPVPPHDPAKNPLPPFPPEVH
jgi:hypothetical protein